MTTLETQRDEIAGKLAELRQPSPKIDALIRTLNAEIAARKAEVEAAEGQAAEIDAQLDLRERDRRAAAQAAHEAEVAASRQALAGEVETMLAAVAAADASCRGLADAVNQVFASRARLSKLALVLSPNGKVPTVPNELELAQRVAARISSVMGTKIAGHRARLGNAGCLIEWPSTAGTFPPDSSWRDSEAKELAGLRPLIEGKA